MVWVKHRSPVQQDAGNPEQPIGDAAQSATVRVSARPERLVADAAFGVMLHGDPRPMEHGLAQPGLGGMAHDGAVYVPAYSSVLIDRGQLRIDFSVTLCIHNASAEKPLVVERIAYYDATGGLVQNYLTSPVAVRPLGTLEVQVPIRDTRGGTSAKFVVDWAGAGPIAEPVMGALILGAEGTRGYSFVGQGRPVRIVGGNR